MIKKITENQKKELEMDMIYRSGQSPKFSSLGVKASNLKLTNISQFQ